MSSCKKKLLKAIITANMGCGCGKPKLSEVYEPKPMPIPQTSNSAIRNPNSFSSSSNEEKDEGCISTRVSYNMDNSECEHETRASKIANSVAVVKESDDPYQDFKDSMLQMVLEEQIYGKDGLEELLNCFLELNSPCHHHLIVQALNEIWNEVISERIYTRKSCVKGGGGGGGGGGDDN